MNKYFPKNLIAVVFLLFALISLEGCKIKKHTVKEEAKVFETPEDIFAELNHNTAEFEWFSTRFSGNVIWGGRNQSIGGAIRIRKDSAIYISVTPALGIEVVRLIISPDSVKYVNRLENNYYVGDNSFINKMLGTNLDFFMLQSLLTGNDFPHFETTYFIMSIEREMVKLSNQHRRKIGNPSVVLSQNIFIETNNFKIRKNNISDNSGKNISAAYGDWALIEDQLFPTTVELVFKDKSTHAELFLKLNKMDINLPQNMSFRIPPRYEEISF
jgi:hypothetical protein